VSPRHPRPVVGEEGESPQAAERRVSIAGSLPRALTLRERSVALPDNVRDLLDWLIDEELKRWQRETR
jgi:hypothetical protein